MHCNGQYWYGHIAEAEKVIGEEIAEIGVSTKEELRKATQKAVYGDENEGHPHTNEE